MQSKGRYFFLWSTITHDHLAKLWSTITHDHILKISWSAITIMIGDHLADHYKKYTLQKIGVCTQLNASKFVSHMYFLVNFSIIHIAEFWKVNWHAKFVMFLVEIQPADLIWQEWTFIHSSNHNFVFSNFFLYEKLFWADVDYELAESFQVS